MSVFSWFRKKPSDDYEQVLADLAASISERQTRLTELTLRERRATLWATIYTLAGWAIYSFVWWLHLVPKLFSVRTRSNIEIERVVHLVPVIGGPIAAVFLRRIVQFWYHRKGAAEEATLKKLLAKQRTTIEEIKQKTNYYSTRNLIERYDTKPGSVPQTPQNRGPNVDQQSQLRQRGRPSGRPEPPQPQTPAGRPIPGGPPQTPATPAQNQMNPAQFAATPPGPPRRQWYDKVADALLGDESTSLDPARSRYALICARCSSHNGLVLESLWEDTQYVCPKCGFFNPAPRSLKGRATPSPDGRPSIRQPSGGSAHSNDGESRLPRPDFLAADDRHSPEPSRSRSRAESHGYDISVDSPGPDVDVAPDTDTRPTGDVSVMEVDDAE